MAIMTFISLLRSKVVQFILTASAILILALQVRKGIREEAVEEIIQEQEKRDEERAQAIRDRVASVPTDGVSTGGADDRGYRD